MACCLVRAGSRDAEIASVFAEHPHGIGQKYAERGEPAERQSGLLKRYTEDQRPARWWQTCG